MILIERIAGTIAYAGGSYCLWTVVDLLDDDDRDPAPMGVMFYALWPVMMAAVGVCLAWHDLHERMRRRVQ